MLLAVLTVSISTPLAFVAHVILPHANLSLVYLTVVLITAARAGMEAAIYASLLSFLSFIFFFTQPYYTLKVENEGDVATLLFFLIIAALTGRLAARMQEEMTQNRFMLQRLTNINQFTQLMAKAPDVDTVQRDLAHHIAQTFNVSAWVVLAGEDNTRIMHGDDGHQPLLPLDSALLERLCQGDGDGPLADWYRFTLRSSHTPLGKVILQTGALDTASHELARMLCDLAAVTIERTQLVSDLKQASLVSETEQLRSALLSSVSHDLRTPLASIIGSTSSLIEYGPTLKENDQQELLQTVLEEAERLNRYIQNLLDMTRLGGGKFTPKCDWEDLNDLVGAAIERLSSVLQPFEVVIDIPTDTPLLFIHGVFIEQALVNVIDNAAHFSPPNGRINLQASWDDASLTIAVCDQGPGIPPAERERVFDMFYTVSHGDRDRKGTGLGLAICRGLLNAHGGEASAHDGLNGQGTCIHLTLPRQEPEQRHEN